MSERTATEVSLEISKLAEELLSICKEEEEGKSAAYFVRSWTICMEGQSMEDLDENTSTIYTYSPDGQMLSSSIGLLQLSLNALMN